MPDEKRKPMLSAGLLTAAAIFLTDPNVAVFDLLPDALGFFFLYLAVSSLAVTVPHFDEVRDGCRKLIFLSLCRLPAGLLLGVILGQSPNDRPMITVFALAFAILELIFLLPTLRQLFDGFYALSVRFAIPQADGTAHISLQGLRLLSYVAFTARAVLSALPEFLLLGSNDPLSSNTYAAGHFGFFAVIAAIVSFLLMLIFTAQFIPYAKSVASGCEDSELLLARRRETAATEDAMHARSRVSTLAFLLIAAAFASCDLLFDNVNFLPDALSGVLLLLFAIFAGKAGHLPRKHAVRVSLAAALFALCSTAAYTVGLLFAANCKYTDLGKKKLADALFGCWTGFSFAEAAAAVLMLALLIPALFALIDRLSGDADPEGVATFTPRIDREERHRMRVLSVLVSVFGMLAFLFAPLELYFRHFVISVASDPGFTDGTVRIQPYGALWIPALLLSLVFACFALRFASSLREAARRRFPV